MGCLLAAWLVLAAAPGAAFAQANTPTTSSSLTPLRSPNGQITLIPNAQGVERERDYFTPTRPWWVNYEDCLANDEFTFTLTSTVTGNNLVFDVIEDTAQLRSTQAGSATIASGILLNDPLQVTQHGNGTLTLSGTLANSSGVNHVTFAVNEPASGSIGNIVVTGTIAHGAGTLTKIGPGTLISAWAN